MDRRNRMFPSRSSQNGVDSGSSLNASRGQPREEVFATDPVGCCSAAYGGIRFERLASAQCGAMAKTLVDERSAAAGPIRPGAPPGSASHGWRPKRWPSVAVLRVICISSATSWILHTLRRPNFRPLLRSRRSHRIARSVAVPSLPAGCNSGSNIRGLERPLSHSANIE